jgi:hypothetical protein
MQRERLPTGNDGDDEMTDKELLELAAKAAGLPRRSWDYEWCRSHGHMVTFSDIWNPLTDDGDALRLAVRLGMFMRSIVKDIPRSEYDADPYAATRRAITRAAAEIGKAMP